jgi:hypothetical protein
MSYFRSINQNVEVCPNNSITGDIGSGSTWTGTSASTLGVNAIQVCVFSTQIGILYIDQSNDGVYWDITDSFNYNTPSVGDSRTIQAVAAYFRTRFKNSGIVTASVRIQSVVCPIVEALPRSLDANGHFKVGVKDITGNFGSEVKVSPAGALKSAGTTRLVGAAFLGTVLDPNFWNNTPTNGGSVGITGGIATLRTNTTSNGAVLLQTVRTARYVASYTTYYRSAVVLPSVTTTTGTNTRRWGAYDSGSGFFFEANQANLESSPVLSVVCRKFSSDSNKITSGSFNGVLGPSVVLDTNYHMYEIYWSTSKAWFCIDDNIVHTFTGTADMLSDFISLKGSAECINAGGNTASNTLVLRSLSINRFGSILTQPQYKYQSGTTAGVVAKYGPGNLHSVIISSISTGSIVTIYDGITAGGTVIYSGTMTLGSQANNFPFALDFKGSPFSVGLFLVISTANSNVTLIYE